MTVTLAEINSLKGRSWMTLQRLAVDAGVSLRRIKKAATRDELRLLILTAWADDEA
jgi:hypothetical protein